MFHDLCTLITNNGFGAFIILLALIWACERVVTALINRNKPVCDCDCCQMMGGEEEDEDEDEDE
jgi:hypothetical protein